ncbi:MAG TPA: hypothetical protein DCY79_23605 [Planctomycetaceae bacterium]|nr:hypothetical protein [Planctomycetaceae bacterium]
MSALHDEGLCQAIDSEVPRSATHVGIVLHDVQGNVVVRQAKTPKFGVTASIPRWRLDGTEPAVALKRCLEEQIGDTAASVYPIPQTWVTENSLTFYFTGVSGRPERQPTLSNSEARWCDQQEAIGVIGTSQNPTSRNRDVAVLQSVQETVPSSYRRVLLVLSELHQMGFGRLRVAPWMHQNGYIEPPGRWSCAIVPAVVCRDDHGAMTDSARVNALRSALASETHHDPWVTLGSQPPFGWSGTCFESPRRVAELFLARFRDLCFMGWGEDVAYQGWYQEMLSATAPYGVFFPTVDDLACVRSAYTGNEASRLAPPPLPRH